MVDLETYQGGTMASREGESAGIAWIRLVSGSPEAPRLYSRAWFAVSWWVLVCWVLVDCEGCAMTNPITSILSTD